jgi:hypothetical protein
MSLHTVDSEGVGTRYSYLLWCVCKGTATRSTISCLATSAGRSVAWGMSMRRIDDYDINLRTGMRVVTTFIMERKGIAV